MRHIHENCLFIIITFSSVRDFNNKVSHQNTERVSEEHMHKKILFSDVEFFFVTSGFLNKHFGIPKIFGIYDYIYNN